MKIINVHGVIIAKGKEKSFKSILEKYTLLNGDVLELKGTYYKIKKNHYLGHEKINDKIISDIISLNDIEYFKEWGVNNYIKK